MKLGETVEGTRLKPIKFSYVRRGYTYFLYRCECGTEKVIYKGNVKKEHTKSCGCLKKEVSPKNLDYGRTFTTTRFPHQNNVETRFKKGCVPWNKGKTYSIKKREGMVRVQYPDGRVEWVEI